MNHILTSLPWKGFLPGENSLGASWTGGLNYVLLRYETRHHHRNHAEDLLPVIRSEEVILMKSEHSGPVISLFWLEENRKIPLKSKQLEAIPYFWSLIHFWWCNETWNHYFFFSQKANVYILWWFIVAVKHETNLSNFCRPGRRKTTNTGCLRGNNKTGLSTCEQIWINHNLKKSNSHNKVRGWDWSTNEHHQEAPERVGRISFDPLCSCNQLSHIDLYYVLFILTEWSSFGLPPDLHWRGLIH